VHLDVTPRRLHAAPGTPVVLTAVVTNTSDVIAGYRIRVLGADPSWVVVEDPGPRLFPGETVTVAVTVVLPERVPAGERRIAIQVRDLTDDGAIAVEEAALEVPPTPRATVALEPTTITAGKAADYTVQVRNEGNTVQAGRLVPRDPEARTTFTVDPAEFSVPPGQGMPLALRASARRPWFGDPVLRPFELRLEGTSPGREAATPDVPPDAAGVFVQKARLSRGLLGLLGLLMAISVFAVVITIALSSVVSRSAADRELALQVAQAREGEATTGSSRLTGNVTDLATGAPVGGVSVEAFGPDPGEPLVTVATTEDGAFVMAELPAGEYRLRVRGAGFAEVWYPAAATRDEAEPVTVQDGRTVSGLTISVGGVPATIEGTVEGEDVAGAMLTVTLPLDTGPLAGAVLPEPGEAPPPPAGGGAVVRTIPVGAEGTFAVDDLASPGVYDLVVAKQGFASSVQRVDVAAGERRSGVRLALVVGDGSIAGTVTGVDGPVGGAKVVAGSGQLVVDTVTLTEAGEEGSFVLRGLPTPGRYSLAVSAGGYSTATLALALTESQELAGVSVVLGRDRVALGGRVAVPGGRAGGVSVSVSDGAQTAETVTRSSSPAGAWRVSGLRVPSTYTITFSRGDLQTQVISVAVDGFGRVTAGAPATDQVDVTMRAAAGQLSGVLRQRSANGQERPVGNVRVTVSSGTQERVVHTASTPAGSVGRFVVEQLPPGTYTVTFSRAGTRATSMIVELDAAQSRVLRPVLVAPARVFGTVSHPEDGSVAGLAVLLYRAAEYGTAAGHLLATTTDGAGRFEFLDVGAPEHYIVEVRTTVDGTVLGTSPPRTVAASQQLRVDIEIATE
jgi:hypothetical protein